MKGGANCTNTAGSYKCTCQFGHLWNDTKCQGFVGFVCLFVFFFNTLNLKGSYLIKCRKKVKQKPRGR